MSFIVINVWASFSFVTKMQSIAKRFERRCCEMSASPFFDPMKWEGDVASHYARLAAETTLEAVLKTRTAKECYIAAARAHTPNI
jgi:hypothetical protein